MYVYVLNPGGRYCNYIFCGIGIGFIQVALGAFLMTISLFCIQKGFGDGHVILCSFGYHFFVAESILALHYANGWSAGMRLKDRRQAHIFLGVCGTVCAIAGTLLVTLSSGVTVKPHGLTGLIAVVILTICTLIGVLCKCVRKTWIAILHVILGVIAFVMSTISLFFSFSLPAFKEWAGDEVMILMAVIVVYYTVFMLLSSFMKYVSKM